MREVARVAAVLAIVVFARFLGICSSGCGVFSLSVS